MIGNGRQPETPKLKRSEALHDVNGIRSPVKGKPTTPTHLSGFITSSPRSNKKIKPVAKRVIRTPSSTLFSPTYRGHQDEPSAPSTPPRQVTKHPSIPLSPVQISLQHNVAQHGHLEQKFDEYDEDEFDPFRFIATLPHLPPGLRPSVSCLPPKAPGAPPISLVLDLDETLVHCSTDPNGIQKPEFSFEVDFHGTVYQVHAKRRPGLTEFLDFIKGRYEVIIFTASQKVYADKVLDILDPEHEIFSHRVFRDDCVCVEGNYLKDISVLGRDLSKTVIVDNSPQAFAYQVDNGIPILSWFECADDRELFKIIPLLLLLEGTDDVRPLVREKYKLQEKVKQKDFYGVQLPF